MEIKMNQNVKIPQEVFEVIKKFEGFKAKAYKCPAGVWTIGYGTTKGVKEGQSITEFDAYRQLVQWFLVPAQTIKKVLFVPVQDYEFGAIMSLVYNVGQGAIVSSTLIKKINANSKSDASNEFLRWDKIRINGELVPSKGLSNRRKVEKLIFEGVTPMDAYKKIYQSERMKK